MYKSYLTKSIVCLRQNCPSQSLSVSTRHSTHWVRGMASSKANNATIMNSQNKGPMDLIEDDMSDSSSSSESGGVPLYSSTETASKFEHSHDVKGPLQKQHSHPKSPSKNNSPEKKISDSNVMLTKENVDKIVPLEQQLKNLTMQTQDNSKQPDATPADIPVSSPAVGEWRPRKGSDLSVPPTTRVLRSQTQPLQKTAPSSKSSISNERDPSNPIIKLLPRPVPSAEYLEQARKPSTRSKAPRSLLIVVDLNGCLLDRGSNKGGSGQLRPYLKDLMEYCLNDHRVMVWSSATAPNVTGMSEQVFAGHQKQPIAVWNRASLHLTPAQAKQKVQVYKQLQWIWTDKNIAKFHPQSASGGQWDQTNTILLDDSIEKAAAQPHNQLLVPEYKKQNDDLEKNSQILLKVMEYIKEAAMHEDVSTFIYNSSFDSWLSFKDWKEGKSSIHEFTTNTGYVNLNQGVA